MHPLEHIIAEAATLEACARQRGYIDTANQLADVQADARYFIEQEREEAIAQIVADGYRKFGRNVLDPTGAGAGWIADRLEEIA